MQLNGQVHPSEDELEQYLMGHAGGAEIETIEEHLLLCGLCGTALEEIEVMALAMRSACRQLSHKQAAAPRWWRPSRVAMAAYAGSFSVLLTVLALGYVYRSPGPVLESEIALAATRSATDLHAPFAAAGSTPLLHLDATSLPPAHEYVVDVVDLSGDRIWSERAAVRQNAVTVHVGKRLDVGRYWVRLSDGNGLELREFELNVH